jgi:hypothetical protein
MYETLRHDIPQVSEEENEVLMAPFSEEDVKLAIFDMEHNKAPGPNGFPIEFYQFFWEIFFSIILLGDFEAGFDEPLL